MSAVERREENARSEREVTEARGNRENVREAKENVAVGTELIEATEETAETAETEIEIGRGATVMEREVAAAEATRETGPRSVTEKRKSTGATKIN